MSISDDKITRRAMLSRTAQASAVAAVGTGLKRVYAAEASSEARGDRIWDMHGHLSGANGPAEESIKRLLKFADRMEIERLIVYMGYPFARDPSPEEIRRQNDQVLRALDLSGGRALGFVYLNPKFTEESLKELDRCVRDGPMVGVKLWVAVRCHEKRLDPIVRRAMELKAPILQHTWLKTTGNMPGESTPEDLAQLAARHPKAAFIAAHVGGQWENGIRAIRATRNVVAEVCGSDPTAGLVEMAVRELGAERVMYGSDYGGRSYSSQLAKVYGADLSERDRRLILGGNIRRMLGPILAAKGIKA